jgi:uncharacterized protein
MMFRSACLASVLLLILVTLGSTAPKTSDSKVKATVNAGKQGQDGKQTIDVTLDIEKGWHLYANPNDKFPDNSVVVTASAGGKPLTAKVDYPKGTPGKPDEGDLYVGTVTIKVTVDRSKLGSAPIDLKVAVSACDANTCLLPGDIKLNVP